MFQWQLLSSTQALPAEFPKGAILLIDKPLGWTSFDVVNKVRYVLRKRLGLKKLKVGHAGTLDPLATGLLILCIGELTKSIDRLQAEVKTYTGTLVFGATTASFDLEKAVNATFPVEHLSDALVQEKRLAFVGDILQVPPMFSAVKVDGKRLYKNARTGETVELPERPVRVDEFEVGPLRRVVPTRTALELLPSRGGDIYLHPEYAEGLEADFRVVCSKGTYIRTLVHDLGQAVGSGAFLSGLRRTHSGNFSVENAWSVEAFVAAALSPLL